MEARNMGKQIIHHNMGTTENKKKKRYSRPDITIIKIDNEISLVMMSANPDGDPLESINAGHFILNPFKIPRL